MEVMLGEGSAVTLTQKEIKKLDTVLTMFWYMKKMMIFSAKKQQLFFKYD